MKKKRRGPKPASASEKREKTRQDKHKLAVIDNRIRIIKKELHQLAYAKTVIRARIYARNI